MTPIEAGVGVLLATGAVGVYLRSDRTRPDALYSAGMLVAVAGAVAIKLAPGEVWPAVIAFAGFAIAMAVTVAEIGSHPARRAH